MGRIYSQFSIDMRKNRKNVILNNFFFRQNQRNLILHSNLFMWFTNGIYITGYVCGFSQYLEIVALQEYVCI